MTILVTGAAGFIGSHACLALIERGYDVIGIDNVNDYYTPRLKADRLEALLAKARFKFEKIDIADAASIRKIGIEYKPEKILHLAAQAGVRYSLTNPLSYVRSNLDGHTNILELARDLECENTVYASSSSVYGCNTKIPFAETDRTDDPASLYGATKKSNEVLSQSYARLYGLSLTGLRFFTVYGPWGRPDMAYWIFAQQILQGKPIRVFNNGQMRRDFTYVDDIVDGIMSALDRPARNFTSDAPHRVYNLGNDAPEALMDMIDYIESVVGTKAEKLMEPMQLGDVQQTWADISRAREELDYSPKISLQDGLSRFGEWYLPRWKSYV